MFPNQLHRIEGFMDVANSVNKLNLLHKLIQICQFQPYHTITQRINSKLFISNRTMMSTTIGDDVHQSASILCVSNRTHFTVSARMRLLYHLEYGLFTRVTHIVQSQYPFFAIQIVSNEARFDTQKNFQSETKSRCDLPLNFFFERNGFFKRLNARIE